MRPENGAGGNSPEKQVPFDSGEATEISKEVPQKFSELGIQPGSVADTAKEQVEFLATLTDEERSKAEKKLGRALDEGGVFHVRITAKDGSRPPREGLFDFSNWQKFMSKKEQKELAIRNPEKPLVQKTEISKAESKPEEGQLKTDLRYVQEFFKKQKEEERSKMTPKEIAEDDKQRKQVEETKKWLERQKKIKEGDPTAIAEEQEERKALHKRIWERSEKPRTEEAPKRIVEVKKEKEEISKELKVEREKTSDGRKDESYVSRKKQKMDEQYKEASTKIKLQEYEKVKKTMERFRTEHRIIKSEEELQQEDADLRKKFGID